MTTSWLVGKHLPDEFDAAMYFSRHSTSLVEDDYVYIAITRPRLVGFMPDRVITTRVMDALLLNEERALNLIPPHLYTVDWLQGAICKRPDCLLHAPLQVITEDLLRLALSKVDPAKTVSLYSEFDLSTHTTAIDAELLNNYARFLTSKKAGDLSFARLVGRAVAAVELLQNDATLCGSGKNKIASKMFKIIDDGLINSYYRYIGLVPKNTGQHMDVAMVIVLLKQQPIELIHSWVLMDDERDIPGLKNNRIVSDKFKAEARNGLRILVKKIFGDEAYNSLFTDAKSRRLRLDLDFEL